MERSKSTRPELVAYWKAMDALILSDRATGTCEGCHGAGYLRDPTRGYTLYRMHPCPDCKGTSGGPESLDMEDFDGPDCGGSDGNSLCF